jgi:thioester reductase-like protein
VNHFGHYRDFHDDNVSATRHLIALATRRKPVPAEFHFVSTLSVAGSPAPNEFRLFTEYDLAPQALDDNYYIRTKQEAEHLVIAARAELPNTSIYRTGNIGFATDSANLQRNIAQNAFFRQVAAFVQLGAVPIEMQCLISHVDVVARALLALAGTRALRNEIHHIETSRRGSMAEFIRGADVQALSQVHTYEFGAFLEQLGEAMDDPKLQSALTQTVESLGLYSASPGQASLGGLTVVSDRTQRLLERFDVGWPEMPSAGQTAMLLAAMKGLRQ